jgi:hypothetical protein
MSKRKATAPAVVDKSRLLQVVARPGVTEDRLMADVATDGIAANASTAIAFLRHEHPGLSLTDMVNSIKAHGERANANDLAGGEQTLIAQSVSLNAIYGELARRASLNMGEYPDAFERYLRLALKAQAQCRATLETLAAIKNPSVVFAKQANIAHGPQQVNNGILSGPNGEPMKLPAHVETGNEQSKLLEDGRDGGTYLDSGTAAAAARGGSKVETVGAFNRTKEHRRQSKG